MGQTPGVRVLRVELACGALGIAAEGGVVERRGVAVGAAGEVVVLAECAEPAGPGALRVRHRLLAAVRRRAAVITALAARVAQSGCRECERRGGGRHYRDPLHALPLVVSLGA